MFEFLKEEFIPDARLFEIGRSLVESVDQQIALVAKAGLLERVMPECIRSGHLVGYISGLAISFASIECKELDLRKKSREKNIQKLYDFVVHNTFGIEQLENYKSALASFFANPTPSFRRGQFDGVQDSRMRVEHGRFINFLTGRLMSPHDPRDDLFVAPASEVHSRVQTGDTAAQMEMAARYSQGRDVETSLQNAAPLYLLATLGGDPRAKSLFIACTESLTS